MFLNTNLNDSHLVGPVNVQPTGFFFQNIDTILLEKGYCSQKMFSWQQIMVGERFCTPLYYLLSN